MAVTTITINISTWNQTEKNMGKAGVGKLLFDNSITHGKITWNNATGELGITDPSSDPTSIVTQSALKAEITNILAAAAPTPEQIAEDAALQSEKDSSVFTDIKLSQINSRIDAWTNLNDVKTDMKRFVRWVKSRLR